MKGKEVLVEREVGFGWKGVGFCEEEKEKEIVEGNGDKKRSWGEVEGLLRLNVIV